MSWLVFAEILPPEIRPKVYPLGIAIMWFMNFILTTLYEPMLSQIGTHGLLWTYAGTKVYLFLECHFKDFVDKDQLFLVILPSFSTFVINHSNPFSCVLCFAE